MIVKFTIEYNTSLNEAVHIYIGTIQKELTTSDGYHWSTELELTPSKIDYSYAILCNGIPSRQEWGNKHSVVLQEDIDHIHIIDRWQDMPSDRALHSSLFTDVLFSQKDICDIKPQTGRITLTVSAPQVQKDESIILLGSSEQFGCWDPSRAIQLTRSSSTLWVTPPLNNIDNCEYKFAIINSCNEIIWECGSNRSINASLPLQQTAQLINLAPAQFDKAAWRGAGVAIPVFSLRSNQSMGVGEFLDLKGIIDWACSVGQKIIQILPINDTTMFNTWEDSYPYNANSSFALHPQYIAPLQVGEIADKDRLQNYIEEGRRLNTLEELDYEAVNKLKNSYLREIFSEIGLRTLNSSDFKAFFVANKSWLEPYALFSHLRDIHGTPYFNSWGDHAHFSQALLKQYTDKESCEYMSLAYYYFVQYHLHLQLLDVKNYAAQNGVAIKGDVPIGVSRTSVDAWVAPELFRLDSQAGAPPDDFSTLGQNWGFPTYNWEIMSKDNYAWWRARFKKMAEYFDAYRIDHILGFFRIWEIPTDAVHGLLGFFNPALPFSIDEIESYGFPFDMKYASPYINDATLSSIFGTDADCIKGLYLNELEPSTYKLKPEYSTQILISKATIDEKIKEGLMALLDEVLFIEDRTKAGLYHPRISSYNTHVFNTLDSDAKDRYMSLYNDFYYHRHNDFWKRNALTKLPQLISSTNMLTCGEDLGMIPQAVPEVMEQEQILSLEIERMPKEPWRTFGDTATYPYLSVCTTSTHDMSPIRAWWLEDREKTQQYYNHILDFEGAAPEQCDENICEKIVERHLASPAMWTILPLQDWLSINSKVRKSDATKERINIPSFPRHYWRYRMHITIEELINACDLNNKITYMISKYDR